MARGAAAASCCHVVIVCHVSCTVRGTLRAFELCCAAGCQGAQGGGRREAAGAPRGSRAAARQAPAPPLPPDHAAPMLRQSSSPVHLPAVLPRAATAAAKDATKLACSGCPAQACQNRGAPCADRAHAPTTSPIRVSQVNGRKTTTTRRQSVFWAREMQACPPGLPRRRRGRAGARPVPVAWVGHRVRRLRPGSQ
jgi:hypothetical protein